jgi:predicted nucleic acid-binding protein
MPFVLDASVAANWFLPDEPALALTAWERIATDQALVPLHWWFEVRNITLVAERRERIPARLTAIVFDRLTRLRLVFAPRPDDARVLELARRRRLTFYDAAYLELAHRENVPLATLDGALRAAAQAERVPLIGE